MIATANSTFHVQHRFRHNNEGEIVTRLTQTATEAGVRADPSSVVNFYVALKSKPLAILTGPAGSGKIALVRSLAQVLTGGDPLRCQMMVGHAWWAGRSGDVGLFTEAQTRFNSIKILAIVEEALRSENAQRIFIACLTRISPAEVTGFFADIAFQIRCGQLMRLPGLHLTQPIPYPPNLFLIGTMDTTQSDWTDAHLLSKASLIQWPLAPAKLSQGEVQILAPHDSEGEFLHSCVRSEQAARLKLKRILERWPQVSLLFIQIEELMRQHAGQGPDAVIGETIIYLANAWSREGRGLFDPASFRNLFIALDLALAQTLLPRFSATIQHSAALRRQLRDVLDGQFPRSEDLLGSLS